MSAAPPWDEDKLKGLLAAPPGREASTPAYIGKYRILRVLGRGAMGVVYEARDVELKRTVALKVLREGEGAREAARVRFQREAEVMARLSHPHVVSVHDAGEHEGLMFLVMELVEGRPFGELLGARKLELQAALRILEKASLGAAAAHEAGIVHRDLKPGNILVGNSGEPKITDFGLAHGVDSGPRLTRTGMPLGTPMYMSPEQVAGGSDSVSPATDVYALGAILYEILTGQPPHAGESSMELYTRIINEDPVLPRKIDPATPLDLQTICLKALEKEPERRYPTAKEFADDLRRHREGHPILAHPPDRLTRGIKWVRRHRVLGSTAVIAFTAAGILALVISVGAARTNREREASVGRALAEAIRLEQAGRLSDAMLSFKLAANLDPGSEVARSGITRLEGEIARREKLRKDALKALEVARPALEKASQAFYREDVDAQETAKRVDAALQFLLEGTARDPGLALGHYLVGRAWDLKGEEDKAEASWRTAIGIDPAFTPARFMLGRLLMNRSCVETITKGGHFEMAAKLAAEALHLVEAASEEKSGLDDDLQREVARALIPYLRKDHVGAVAICEAAEKRFEGVEGVEEFHWIEGLCCKGTRSVTAISRAIAIRPKYFWPLLTRAALRVDLEGDLRGAIEDCSRAIQVQPGNWHGHHSRGVYRKSAGDNAGALADYDEAIRLNPSDPGSYFGRGNVKTNLGDLAGAIGDYTRARDAGHPDLHHVHYNRGNIFALLQKWDEAIADYDEAIRRDAAFAKCWTNRGRTKLRAGRFDEAIPDLTEAIRLNPRNTEPWSHRGDARARLGDREGAMSDLDEALRLPSPDAYALYLRGRLHHEGGDAVRALADFRLFLTLAPAGADVIPDVEDRIRRLTTDH